MNLELYFDRKNNKIIEIINGENLNIEGLEKLAPNTDVGILSIPFVVSVPSGRI